MKSGREMRGMGISGSLLENGMVVGLVTRDKEKNRQKNQNYDLNFWITNYGSNIIIYLPNCTFCCCPQELR
jgi:hypothetical protein